MNLISFVVPSHLLGQSLLNTIKSILTQKTNSQFIFEVLVIINSKKISSQEIQAFYSSDKVKFFLFQEQGRSFARNKGVELASGDTIAFVDSDTVLDENWTLNLVNKMNHFTLAAQGQIIPDGHPDFLTNYRYWRLKLLTGARFLNCFVRDDIVPVINTAACLYKKSALREMGGFETALKRSEDFDLSRKVFHTGGVLLFSSESVAKVHSDLSILDYLKRSFEVGYWNCHFHHMWNEEKVYSPYLWFKGERLVFNLFLGLNSLCTWLGFKFGRISRPRSWHFTNLYLKAYGSQTNTISQSLNHYDLYPDVRVMEINDETYFFKNNGDYLKIENALNGIILSVNEEAQELIQVLSESSVLRPDAGGLQRGSRRNKN